MSVIDDHLTGLPEPQRSTLAALRDALRAVLPEAEEKISYRMPCFALNGKAVAGFDGFTNHCSYFPHSGNVVAATIERYGPLPDGLHGEGGTLRFPIDQPLPEGLVRRLVEVRLDEIAAMKGPRSSGSAS